MHSRTETGRTRIAERYDSDGSYTRMVEHEYESAEKVEPPNTTKNIILILKGFVTWIWLLLS